MIKDDSRFLLLRKCWDLMLTGNYTPQEILDKLNNEWGFRTKVGKKRGSRPMARSTLYRMFTNPFYAGLIDGANGSMQGKHDSMISLDEFDKVQVLLGREGRPRQRKHNYSYTGLIKCEECGGSISATHKEKIIVGTGELKNYTLYYCANARNKRKQCSQTGYVNSNILDDHIKQEIDKFQILPEFKDWALNILSERNENEVVERQKIYESQQNTLIGLRKQLDKLTQALIKELVDEDTYKGEKARIQKEIMKIEQSIKQTGSNQDNWIQLVEGVFNFACHANEIFNNGDTEERKIVLSKIGVNCTLKDKKLNISKHPWLVAVEKHYPPIESKYMLCELDKKPYTETQKEAFASLSPLMRE